MTQILVAYGTRYGSTREVAETVAATLEEQGIDTDVKQAKEVRSLDGYDAVVLGTPLYLGALHKDVRALLEKNQAALEHTPFALFALGPIKADDGLDGSRAQLINALAKLPVPTPAATAVFVGAYDPARLGFRDKMLTALPASPLHGEPAHDERDWDAIGWWVRDLFAARPMSSHLSEAHGVLLSLTEDLSPTDGRRNLSTQGDILTKGGE